jgi:hypothetical protein
VIHLLLYFDDLDILGLGSAAAKLGFGNVAAINSAIAAYEKDLARLRTHSAGYPSALDSSALTAGTVQAANTHLRGATMGLHSMAGYAGGFLGPLGVGLALDLAGSDVVLGWGLAFGHLAVVTLIGLVVLRRLGQASSAAEQDEHT